MVTEKDMEITPVPAQESRTNGKSEYRREDAGAESSSQFLDVYHKIDDKVPIFGTSNGAHNVSASPNDPHDELTQLLMELTFQNDYLKAQIGATQSQVQQTEVSREESGSGQDVVASEQVNHLNEMVKCLNKEIQEQKETQKAAENALQHLRVAYSEADGKVQELSMKLVEAQHKMEQEIQERDDKYVELDSKFGRLHKRAKQRIQEIQKEKDDLEAQLRDVSMKAEQASNQQTLAQQELERTRQQTSEALRSMDVERQQLRAANNKLRENIDEMHHSLEAKANALEGLQQAVSEKERMLEDTRHSLEVVEERRQSTLVDLSAKHQKQLESLENQLADALSERSKAAETLSSLEMLLVEKDSKIVELEAALTSEAVRFEAALEEMRGELIHLKDKQEKEIQSSEAACQALRRKLEASESACLRSEFEAAKMRSRLELDVSNQNHLLDTKEAELVAAKDEINRLESEFSAYKVRAHALLLKKDAELSAAKDSDLLRAQEEAVKEAEREAAVAIEERDKVIQNLHEVLANHDKEVAYRDAALSDAEQRLRSITMKLESTTTQHLSDKEAWQRNLESIEENWRLKYGMLEAQKIVHIGDDLQKDLEALRLRYKKLKEEHKSFRDIADRTIEDKEKEIAKLMEDNRNLHRSFDLKSNVDHIDKQSTASLKHDTQNLSIAVAEQQILLLARKQAQREEELAQSQRHILALQDEIEELERENRLHSQQEAMLKAELRSVERSQKREGVDMTYLKNVILKLLETGEVEALLPVVGTLLQFSPEEVRKCQQAYHTSDVASTPSSASAADALSTPRSVFSRFSF